MTTLTATLRRPRSLTAAAAIAYSAAWIAGLAVPVPAIDVDAPAAEVLAAVTGHEGAYALREVLVHGVAALALAVVALTVAAALRRAEATPALGRFARPTAAAGLAAATLSVVQLVAGLLLAGVAAPDGDAAATHALFDTVNVVDGVKMLALAAFAGLIVVGARRIGLLSPRMRVVGIATAAALVPSAVGYLLALPSVALAAYVSLPLLLVFVTAAGLAAARRA